MKSDGHTIIARVPKALHDWLIAEQTRLFVEKGIKLPVAGVVRMILQQAKQQDDTVQTPKRKVASSK